MSHVNSIRPGNRLGMPFTSWPLSDQVAWTAAFAPRGLLEEDPGGSALRPATRLSLETCYARWLAWLKARQPGALSRPPEERATPEQVREYVESLSHEITAVTLSGYATRLKRALELIAPGSDWPWFQPLLRKLERRAHRAGPTRATPIVPSDQLFRYGLQLMKEAEAAGNSQAPQGAAPGLESSSITKVAQAELFRDGLMFAFLAARPLRLKNMLGLDIGEHFLTTAAGFEVFIEGALTKNWNDLSFPMPATLTPHMRRYKDHYRKTLADGPQANVRRRADQPNALWLARSGQRFPVASFEDMIARRSMQGFGVRLTPHRFRHCAATTLANENPEEFHIIRIILGHTTIATAEKYYVQGMTKHAFLMSQQHIETRRGATRQKAGRPSAVIPDNGYGAMIFSGHSEAYKRRFIG